MINIATLALSIALGALGGALAWRVRLYRQRPRCSSCGRPLPPELRNAVCCWECIAAVMQAQQQARPGWPPLTPDADRLLQALDEEHHS